MVTRGPISIVRETSVRYRLSGKALAAGFSRRTKSRWLAPFRSHSSRTILGALCYLLLVGFLDGLAPTTQQVVAAPFIPERNAQCVAFSPDGKLAATGKSGLSNSEFPPRPHPSPRKCGVVHIWDVETGKLLRRMETFGDLTRVAFSPDGQQVAYSRLFSTTDDLQMNEVRVWNVSTGESLKHFDRCYGFDFSPDGKQIAVLSRTRCTLFSTESWDKQHEIKPLAKALSVRFSPDGKVIAGIARSDTRYKVRSCDAVSGDLLAESVGLKDPFYSLAFAPDNRWIATGHPSGGVLLWDTETFRISAHFRTGGKGQQSPFFAPGGSVLASGDQQNGDVVFWDIASGKEIHRYTFQRGAFRTYLRRESSEVEQPETDPIRFAFSPSGDSFLAGCYGGIIRMITDGREVRRFAE
jgi:WD40 repeat protein